MQALSRRSLLVSPLILGGFGAAMNAFSEEGGTQNPHFFLQILIESGMDSLYLFDARPKIFTAAGRIANFAKDDAFLWEGAAGGRCWASALAKPFESFKSRLAIVNGVFMPAGFEGHEQNVNSALTANPFGGNYFGSQLTAGGTPLPFVGLGGLKATLSNRSSALILDSETANQLASNAQKKAGGGRIPSWRQVVGERARACGQGAGALAQGCLAYADGLDKAGSLAADLGRTGVTFRPEASDLEKRTGVALSYFRNRLTRTALITYTPNKVLDTHAPADAARAQETFEDLNASILATLKLLQETPFDAASGVSMLDVTTVMICSEFSRTHMQAGKTVETTGTDHNALSNMVLLCGKGIRGDLVVGASDLDVLNEDKTFAAVSAAHNRIDPEHFKRMGKVFDYAKQESSAALPEEFKPDDYITIPTIMNTLLSGFGAPKSSWLSNDTRARDDSKPAAIISRLLT